MHTPDSQTELSFNDLGIAPKLLDILVQNRFTAPTPIQHKSIPIALEGKDVIGIAQTGTGKTLAFGIPMIQLISKTRKEGLVILPTRELALQVEESLSRIGKHVGLRTAVLIGGESMDKQLRQIRARPHVIIATPGRLNDHLEQRTVNLSNIGILVLDEADRMLDMGFEPQIKRILKAVPAERQTMLFSATMPDEILGIAKNYMKLPVRIEVARPGTASMKVSQEFFIIEKSEKPRLLEKVLSDYKGTVLVFSRTKHGAHKVSRLIQNMGHTSAELHSDRSLAQRRKALEGFKNGQVRVLVATDIAARGIDVKGIELVLNYDLPDHTEDYVHRIGRTGRASMEGHAISFACPDQRRDMKDIERLVRSPLIVSQVPVELPPHRAMKLADERPEYEGRSYGRSGGSRGGRSSSGGYGRSSSYSRPERGGNGAPPTNGSYGRRPSHGSSSRTQGHGPYAGKSDGSAIPSGWKQQMDRSRRSHGGGKSGGKSY